MKSNVIAERVQNGKQAILLCYHTKEGLKEGDRKLLDSANH